MSALGQKQTLGWCDRCPLYPRKQTSELARITFDVVTPAPARMG